MPQVWIKRDSKIKRDSEGMGLLKKWVSIVAVLVLNCSGAGNGLFVEPNSRSVRNAICQERFCCRRGGLDGRAAGCRSETKSASLASPRSLVSTCCSASSRSLASTCGLASSHSLMSMCCSASPRSSVSMCGSGAASSSESPYSSVSTGRFGDRKMKIDLDGRS